MRATGFFIAAAISGCMYENNQSDSFEVTEAVEQIVIEVDGGDVTLRGEDRATVLVERTVGWDGPQPPEVRAHLEDGVLTLEGGCDSWSSCEVNHDVILPRSVPVVARTGSGDIEATTLTGVLDVETGSGDLDLTQIKSEAFFGETGSGDIDAFFTRPPERVDLSTGSGDVEVELPAAGYEIDVDTGSGDVDIDHTLNDNDSGRLVRVSTGSGDVLIDVW